MKCINCGRENKNTNIKCEFCGTMLNTPDNFLNKDYSKDDKNIIHLSKGKTLLIVNIFLIIATGVWFIVGASFVAVSVYSNITDYNKAKYYLETEGKLVNYDKCELDDDGTELCEAVYEYVVDGVSYHGSPDLLSNKSGFKEVMTVKYNPNSPSEYLIDAGWNNLLIIGIILVVITVSIFIVVNIFVNKLYKTEEDVKKDN